ncbi:MAG TPA: creatininase family protein [Urbifossiella sp.]|nr:creatininase family protein [Urbifossiella sp.]
MRKEQVEENGPYVVTGKHNFIIRAVADAIARKLGTALVAPVVPFVPESGIDPPTGHMQYPGTISVSEGTFRRLLTDICGSMRAHRFRDIVLIGDSGGNQKGMRAVAAALNAKWAGGKTRVHFIPEYYDHEGVEEWLAKQGIKQVPEGYHDDYVVTATLTAVDPVLTRAKQRQAAGKYRINGIDLTPVAVTAERGKKIIEIRADATVAAIHKVVGAAPRP